MYQLMRKEIRRQLDLLRNEHKSDFDALRDAWEATAAWRASGKRPRSCRCLVPYVGSGLNNLTRNGMGSWDALVSSVAKAVDSKWTDLDVRRSGLTGTQRLEVLLRQAAPESSARAAVRSAFEQALGDCVKPSAFHKRIRKIFPLILTTNYNNLLASASPDSEIVDLTERHGVRRKPDSSKPAVVHVHGTWRAPSTGEQEERIFRGLGASGPEDHPCLVISEHQYHHLYENRRAYSAAVEGYFGEGNLILFLGASLASDESGIHQILRQRTMSSLPSPAGVYVGLELPRERQALLRLRDLVPLNVNRRFGFGRLATEAALHALLDEFERDFSKAVRLPPRPIASPEVLAIGMSSWNSTISLGAAVPDLEKESAKKVLPDGYIEEVGGQHLLPSLELIRRGRVVALATVIGDDGRGDRVMDAVKAFVKLADNTEGGDFISAFVHRQGITRLTTTITYGGTRAIFDFDGEVSNLRNPARQVEWDFSSIRSTSLKALYLGTYFLDQQERALATFPDVPYRFLETGTVGPSSKEAFARVVAVAAGCTHVLASSAFAWRLAHRRAALPTDPEMCQRKMLEDGLTTRKVKCKAAFRRIWSRPDEPRVLVILLGGGGAMVVSGKRERITITHVPARKVNSERARSWLGCGDLFRAVFVDETLGGRTNPIVAARNAAKAVAEKICRMSFFPAR